MLKTITSFVDSLGSLTYKGLWNAATNTPTLASGVGTTGDYYVVSVPGTTTLDGISSWAAGDWAIFNGSVWEKYNNPADTLSEVLANGNTTAGTDISVTTGDDITFADNSKAIFGAGSDLQVYHDGFMSYIDDAGNGDLRIRASNDISFRNYANEATAMNLSLNNGSELVQLYYAGSLRLATSASGISVTGSVTAGGLTMASGSQGVIGVFGTSGLQLIGQTGSDNIIGTMGVNEPLIFRTESIERMRVDALGRVAIGTSSPALAGGGTGLHINATSYPELKFTNSTTGAGAGDGSLLQSSGNNFSIQNREAGSITFSTSNTLRATLDALGNLGIGISSMVNPLHVGVTPNAASKTSGSAFDGGALRLDGNLANTGDESAILAGSNDGLSAGIGFMRESGVNWGTALKFYTHSPAITTADELTERARLTSEGSLLVGKTTADLGVTAGIELNGQYDVGYFTRSAEKVLVVNRLGTGGTESGTVVEIRSNGTTVGSIGTNSGYMVIGSPVGTDAHLLIGNGIIHPATSTGAVKDNAIDIGGSGNRFKDLYLSGGVVFGTTGGAVTSKTLEDYEEGTWIPAFTFATSGSVTYTTQLGTYRKVGSLVFVSIAITIASVSSPTGAASINNLPFTSGSDSNFSAMTIGQVRSLVTARPDLAIYQNTSTTKLTFSIQASNAGFLQFQGSDLQAGTVFFISGSYISV
jgi:hypothetical protein